MRLQLFIVNFITLVLGTKTKSNNVSQQPNQKKMRLGDQSVTMPMIGCSKLKSKRDLSISTCETHSLPVIKIAIGLPEPQLLSVVVDTGASGLVVPMHGLQNLVAQETYDPKKSSTSSGFEGKPELTHSFADGLKIRTVPGADIVQIGEYVSRMKFDLATSFEGHLAGKGNLGLPGPYEEFDTKNDPNAALQIMKDFPEKAVNFYFANLNREMTFPGGITGEITFGKPLPSRFDTAKSFTWLDTQPGLYWSVSMTELNIIALDGSLIRENHVSIPMGGQEKAVFDTGAATIVLPNKMFEKVMNLIPEKFLYYVNSNMYATACENSRFIKKFILTLSDEWIEFNANNIFVTIPENLNYCKILVRGWNEEFVILGTPFHRPFYVSYSYTRKQIGLTPKL